MTEKMNWKAFGGHADDDAANLLERLADVDGNPDEEIRVDEGLEGYGRYYFDADGYLHRCEDNGDEPIIGWLRKEIFDGRVV